MILSDDSPLLLDDSNYLEHYGVKGMKWGVRRAEKKAERNRRYEKQFDKYDKQEQRYRKDATKVNAKNVRDREALRKRVANEARTAKRYNDKADKSTTEVDYAKNRLNSAIYSQASAIRGVLLKNENRMGRYTENANRLERYADNMAIKASVTRRKIAKNELYIAVMRQKVNEFAKSDIEHGRELVERMNRIPTSYRKRK